MLGLLFVQAAKSRGREDSQMKMILPVEADGSALIGIMDKLEERMQKARSDLESRLSQSRRDLESRLSKSIAANQVTLASLQSVVESLQSSVESCQSSIKNLRVELSKCKKSKLDPCLNRAKGGKATALSQHDSHSASSGFDGPRKYWHSAKGMPQWLMYELKDPLPIDKISWKTRYQTDNHYMSIHNRDCPKSFVFEGSNDAKTFTPLLTVKDLDVDTQCKPKHMMTEYFHNNKLFKYYRFKVTDVKGRKNGNKWAVISDLQLFGNGKLDPVCLNRAKGGKPTALSHHYSDSNFASDGFDGPGEYWHSAEGMPQWLMYELKDPSPINKISWKTRHETYLDNAPRDCPKSFVFEGSNDAKTFTPLLTVKDLDVDTLCKPNRTMTECFHNNKLFKYYRFYVNDVKGRENGNKWTVISDLQFFGNNDNNECESYPCQNGATCNNNHKCKCKARFTEANCETAVTERV